MVPEIYILLNLKKNPIAANSPGDLGPPHETLPKWLRAGGAILLVAVSGESRWV